jgi:sialidase-1
MKNILVSFLILLVSLNLFSQQKNEIGTFSNQILFEAGTQGYYTFRIASMVSTKKGTLLAFAEARKGKGGDYDPISMVMRRSIDFGKTWDKLIEIESRDSVPCGNAMPIVDNITGDVHLVSMINYEKCLYRKSTDDGLTWSSPVDISDAIFKFKENYPWVVAASGPGHGIQMTNGRLIVPFWLSNGEGNEMGSNHRGHRPSIVVSVYSDDHGKTWKAGEIAIPDNEVSINPSETSVIQLTDGRVMFNSRNESINYRRLVSFSEDGATNWSSPEFHDAFFEPICFGSMCRYSMQPDQSKNRILFCNPDSRQDPWVAEKPSTPRSARNRHRTNLIIRMSYDEGITWPVKKVIDPGISGYSDIAVTPDGMIHVLYEGGAIEGTGNNHFKNAQMSVASFDLEWLTNGKDKLKKGEKPLKMGN